MAQCYEFTDRDGGAQMPREGPERPGSIPETRHEKLIDEEVNEMIHEADVERKQVHV